MYFAEKDAVEKWSFLDSFWWGLMVLTTVGSGSTAPSTALGKVHYHRTVGRWALHPALQFGQGCILNLKFIFLPSPPSQLKSIGEKI